MQWICGMRMLGRFGSSPSRGGLPSAHACNAFVMAVVLLFLTAPAAFAIPAISYVQSEATPVAGLELAKQDPNAPVTIRADEMGADEQQGVAIARGHVEVMQGDSILTANQLTYYQKADLLVAEGEVTMLQPTGDVYFADKAELKDQMKRAVINDFKARFKDNAVLVAKRAVKVNSAVTNLQHASYTPCNLCEAAAPLWQMNAHDATVDALDERVIYHDAFLEVFGIPTFYTPYLSHPTPDSRGKSGFLTPTYGGNQYFGTFLKVPYYWRIDETRDMVITPWVMTSDSPLLASEYHQLTDGGNYRFAGSITDPQRLDANGHRIHGAELRGHIFANGNEMVGEDSRVGFSLQRTTDDTYLRRYGFGGQESLFSNAYYEYARGRNFGLVNTVAIQGLRSTDNARTTPLILPDFQGYYETQALENGIKFHMSGNAQSLTRQEGINQRRISVTPGATLPITTDAGHMFITTVNLRQDVYQTEDIGGSNDNATSARALPQAALEWRYPLIRSSENGSIIVEPIALAVLQPNGGNRQKISNEDSKLLELSDTNIFSLDRMPGLDLYDAGSRVAYGARAQYYASDGVTFDGMLGQNYSFNSDTPFPNSTRAGEQFSDVIGQLGASYEPYSFNYRFAVNPNNLGLNRNEIGLGFSKPWLTFSGSYDSIKNNQYLKDSQEAQGNATLPLDENWSLYGNARRDLDLDRWVTANGGAIYKNECFSIMLDALRIYSRDRDIIPTTEYTVRVGFKNLGEFSNK